MVEVAKFEELVEDYSTKPVPSDKTTSGFRVALIVVGVSIALPAFLSGARIGLAIGFQNAVLAFLVGGAILAAVGSLTAIVASRARLTTYMLVQFSFGPRGAHFVNFLLSLTMLGWFGVNASLFGKAVVTALGSMELSSGSNNLYVVSGGVLMILTTIFGFKALNKLSLFAVPVLIIILVAILVSSLEQTSFDALLAAGHRSMSLGLAISAVVGGKMVAVATMPDVGRYLPNRSQAVWGMFLSFVLGAPIVLVCSAVPSLVTNEPYLMKIITDLGLGLWALVVMVFATWTSNAANLYSTGLGLASIFKNSKRWKLTAVAGIFGTLVALGGIIEWFVSFLIVLSIMIPPIAGIYVVHFYTVAKGKLNLDELKNIPVINYRAFIAWGLGTGVAFLSSRDYLTLTTVPACDAILISASFYWVLNCFFPSQHCASDEAVDFASGPSC